MSTPNVDTAREKLILGIKNANVETDFILDSCKVKKKCVATGFLQKTGVTKFQVVQKILGNDLQKTKAKLAKEFAEYLKDTEPTWRDMNAKLELVKESKENFSAMIDRINRVRIERHKPLLAVEKFTEMPYPKHIPGQSGASVPLASETTSGSATPGEPTAAPIAGTSNPSLTQSFLAAALPVPHSASLKPAEGSVVSSPAAPEKKPEEPKK